MTDRDQVLRKIRALLLTATVAALAMLATVPSSHAAQFWTEPGTCIDGSKTCTDVHLKGQIEPGDDVRFKKAVAKVPKGKATVYLDSIGGLYEEGIAIARTIRRSDWHTFVDANTYCESMCANIWLAGTVRYVNRTAHIGFHTLSNKVGNHRVRNNDLNALLLWYYREIGISAKAGRVLIAADPDKLTWLSEDLARKLDIKFSHWPEALAAATRSIVVGPSPGYDMVRYLRSIQEHPVGADEHTFPKVVPSEPSPRLGEDQALGSQRPTASTNAGITGDSTHTPTSGDGATSRIPQHVVLYDEDPSDPKGKQYVGSVIWRTEPITASSNQPGDIAVHADIEVPDRSFKMTMSFRHNTDSSLPASHTVELTFIPQDFSGGGVANVLGILMKSNEQARGTPLAGLAVKVTDGFFLVGLSKVDANRSRNLQLLKERSWFNVPLVYANQRRAIIAIEKGPLGEHVFNDAFEKW